MTLEKSCRKLTIFSNFLVITHFELFKLSFSIGFNVKWAKVSPEFEDKFDVVIGPGGVGVWVHDQRLEVIECCPLEGGEDVVELVCVKLKHVGSVTEVEL